MKNKKFKLRTIKVTFANGYTITTNMASDITDKEMLDYYKIGRFFNLGNDHKDNMQPVIKAEILPDSEFESLGKLNNEITAANYSSEIKNYDLLKFSSGGQKIVEYINKFISMYDKSELIKQKIDKFLILLNKEADKQQPKEEIKPEPAPAAPIAPAAKPKKERKKRETKPKAEKPAKMVKPKAEKAPKKQKAVKTPKPVDTAERVENISPEVKFIKRFVKLDKKVQTRQQILAFLDSLQRAIRMHLIRKTSKYAKEIEHIQNELIKLYNTMAATDTILLDAKDKALLEPIAGSEKTCPAIAFIKRFISIQGKSGPDIKKKAEKLLNDIEVALKKGIINKDNKYAKEIQYIINETRVFLESNESKLSISHQALNGLMGIAGCNYKKNRNLAGNSKGMGMLKPENEKNVYKAWQNLYNEFGSLRLERIIAIWNTDAELVDDEILLYEDVRQSRKKYPQKFAKRDFIMWLLDEPISNADLVPDEQDKIDIKEAKKITENFLNNQ